VGGERLGRDPRRARARAQSELAVLLEYERGLEAAQLLESLLELRSTEGASRVRDAADRLVREHAPWALDLGSLAAELIAAAGDERDRRLFVAWTLSRQGQTLEVLAGELGLLRRHANKLVARAEARVRKALEAARGPLPWYVSTLRSRLGAVGPALQLQAELARLGAVQAPAPELLAWLAGPYRPVTGRAGWVAVEPKRAVGATAECLAADGGVRRLADVEAELAELGIRPGNLVPWLSSGGAVVVHDLVVSLSGPVGEVAERLVDAHGTARNLGEIAADLSSGGRPVDEAVLARALGGRRFERLPTGAVRLAAWGKEGHQAAKHGQKHCREAKPEADGWARVQAEKPGDRPAPHDGGATGRAVGQTGRERLWLWVRVDAEVLRGAEAAVPAALVESLGLAPLARRTYSSRYGPVTLAHEAPQPSRGAVRAVALAAGARADDTLLLGFSPGGELEVEVRRCQAGALAEGAAASTHFPEIMRGTT
jgi:hypothetical protein